MELLYNCVLSNLTLVINNDTDLLVIDSIHCQVYGAIATEPFIPTNEEIKNLWKRALDIKFDKDSSPNNLTNYKEMIKEKSTNHFNKFVEDTFSEERYFG